VYNELSARFHTNNRQYDTVRANLAEWLAMNAQIKLALPLFVNHATTVIRTHGEQSMKTVYALMKLATAQRLLGDTDGFGRNAEILLRVHIQHCGVRHTREIFAQAGLTPDYLVIIDKIASDANSVNGVVESLAYMHIF
jgi:hypothetical protein